MQKAAAHTAACIQQRNIQTYIAMLKRQALERLRRSIFLAIFMQRSISLCERMFHKTIDMA